jgi:hypothetical protein
MPVAEFQDKEPNPMCATNAYVIEGDDRRLVAA